MKRRELIDFICFMTLSLNEYPSFCFFFYVLENCNYFFQSLNLFQRMQYKLLFLYLFMYIFFNSISITKVFKNYLKFRYYGIVVIYFLMFCNVKGRVSLK